MNSGSSQLEMQAQGRKNMTHALRLGSLLLVSALAVGMSPLVASAQDAPDAKQVPFGNLNLSSGKDPVKISADSLEMRDKEGVAVFSGNVAVVQGQTTLKAGKMTVYYNKAQSGDKDAAAKTPQPSGAAGLSAAGIDHLEVSDKVYLKSGTQVATGDSGTYDGKSQVLVLQGKKVVLTDGDNVATGCKLTAHVDTGKAFLESCKGADKGRVSIIMAPKNQQGGTPAGKN